MIKGVNLGNWLVLEKWMSPGLFAGTQAEDETQLSCDLDDVAKRERLKVHRDSYITETDFAYLANHGINTVRIPVPFFIFGDYPPYVGCIEYLDRAFDWAETYQIKILIDLHTVPDSQNGFDNGGICGVCYTTAYRRIRAQSDDVSIVFHDGFRIREWDGFFTRPDFERIVVDTHLYLMEYTFRTGDENLDGYLGHIQNEFAPTVREMSRQFPLLIGEWCLDPMSPKAVALTREERLGFYRTLAEAQLKAWDGAVGWFFWSYKLLVEGSDLDGWELRKSIDLGYLPENLGQEDRRRS